MHPFRGHLDCVKVLLQLNAPLRPRTPEEDTPKELAVRYKQKEVVEILGKEERGEGVTGESRGKGLVERMEGRGGVRERVGEDRERGGRVRGIGMVVGW